MVRNRTTKKMLAENYDLVDAQVNELINSVNGLVEYHSVLNDTAQSKLRYELDKVLISVGKTNININSIELNKIWKIVSKIDSIYFSG